MSRYFLYRKRTGQVQGCQAAVTPPECFAEVHPMAWTAADPEMTGFDVATYDGALLYEQANHRVRTPTAQELLEFPAGIIADNKQLSRLQLKQQLNEAPVVRLLLDLINAMQIQVDELRAGHAVPRSERLAVQQEAEKLIDLGTYDIENSSPEML